MSVSTDAILAYGYDLGDPNEGLLIEEADEYSNPPWFDDDEDDFGEALLRRLLDVSGFTERYEDGRDDGYSRRKDEAEKTLGVEVVTHCSGEAPSFALVASGSVLTAIRGYPVLLDPAHMGWSPGWMHRLGWALNALNITPKQAKPGWLLMSYWG